MNKKLQRVSVWVFTLSKHNGALAQYRLKGPFSYLAKSNFKFNYIPSLKALFSFFSYPDVIIFQRNVNLLIEFDKIIKLAKLGNIPTLLDIDDLLISIPREHPSYFSFKELKPVLVALLKSVEYIIVSNKRFKDYLAVYNPNIYVLPNLLDEKFWKPVARIKKGPDDKIVIGYAGTPTHSYDLAPIIPAIKEILFKYPEKVLFKFISYIPEELKGHKNVVFIEGNYSYSKFARLLLENKFDIALAPLIDNDFNRCKSNIKFLEYSICGYPGIYSRVGPYLDSVKDRYTGILIGNSAAEWVQAMEFMLNNFKEREAIASNAYKNACDSYLLKDRAGEWLQVYGDISRQRPSFNSKILFLLWFYAARAQLRKLYWDLRNICHNKAKA